MSYVKMLDEVDYMKKEKALARYFRKNYKYLIFEVYPKLKRDYKIDGKYEIILPTCELFERVYGKMKFKFSVQKDVALLEDITPQEILLACYSRDVPTYKGIPYDSQKDLKKIKMMEAVICQSGKKN